MNAKRRSEIVGAASWNDEDREFAPEDGCEVAVNGAVAAEDDGNIGICDIRPGDPLVLLKGPQMEGPDVRSEYSDGAQAGAG